ncbi:MAG: glycosyltransferase family 87 protein [Ruegeria sp.]
MPALLLAFCGIWISLSWIELLIDGKAALNVDFRVFWAAATLAASGAPLDALNIDQLSTVHGVVNDDWMPWAYPAGFLVALMPLGVLSFSAAWLAFTLVSIGASLAAFRPFSGGITPVWLGFALAPAMMPNLTMGQTSVLWTAGIVGALALLRAERPIMAGVVIGLLTLKPQLGLLVPIALIAATAWPTFISAAVTTIAISVISTLIVGIEYWGEMYEMMRLHFESVRGASDENALMISAFAAFAGVGIPDAAALTLQWAITGLAAITVFVAWRSPKVGFDLKAATLLLGIVSSTPYLWFYESALLAPAALFLLRAGVLGNSTPGLILACLMWLGITPAFLILFFTDLPDIGMRFAFAPVALAAIVVCVTALVRRIRSPLPAPFASQENP